MIQNVIPITAIIIFNCGIILEIRKMRKEINAILQRQLTVDREEDWQVIKMMMIVTMVFILTTAPPGITAALYRGDLNVGCFVSLMFWSSCVINPFIYCMRNKNYREAYISTLKSIFCLPNTSKSAEKTNSNISITTQVNT